MIGQCIASYNSIQGQRSHKKNIGRQSVHLEVWQAQGHTSQYLEIVVLWCLLIEHYLSAKPCHLIRVQGWIYRGNG